MLSFEDRLDLRELAEAYGLAVDSLDAGWFATLWTADAVLAVHDASGEIRRWQGDEIGGMLAGVRRYLRTFHFVGNHRAHEAAGTVSGTTYCVAHHLRATHSAAPDAPDSADGSDAPPAHDRVVAIRYDDRYARRDGRPAEAPRDGISRWRFVRRDVRILWRTRRDVEELGVDP